jgi:hypothetical protein
MTRRLRLGGPVVVFAALAAAACAHQRWELPRGRPAVALCDGGQLFDEEEPQRAGGTEVSRSKELISSARLDPCMKLMRREYGSEWSHRAFIFEFSTNDAGMGERVCAVRVPSAPRAATCAAELIEGTLFEPGLSSKRYEFHFFID